MAHGQGRRLADGCGESGLRVEEGAARGLPRGQGRVDAEAPFLVEDDSGGRVGNPRQAVRTADGAQAPGRDWKPLPAPRPRVAGGELRGVFLFRIEAA